MNNLTAQPDWLTGLLGSESPSNSQAFIDLVLPPQNSTTRSSTQTSATQASALAPIPTALVRPTDAMALFTEAAMIPGAQACRAAAAKGAGGKGGSTGGGGSGGGGASFGNYIAGQAGAYNIELVFLGDGWNDNYYNEAKAMADIVCQFIVGDISDITRTVRQGKSLIEETIDDLRINLTLRSIDGIDGTLGQAGPTSVRRSNELTVEGMIELDTADVSAFYTNGLFDDIMLHEMFHVTGLGTLWDYGSNPLTSNYAYTGSQGRLAYQLAGFEGDPLVENGGGSGTAGGHWEEGDGDRQTITAINYDNGSELMTGYINGQNWLSWVSIASLEDLGYTTIWDSSAAMIAGAAGVFNNIALATITPGAGIQDFAVA